MMLERVRELIDAKRLFSPGSCIIVAVSGGPDSLCLLHIMHQLAPEFGWKLVVAHLNHGFRGDAAAADAQFVATAAGHLGWPAVLQEAKLGELVNQGGSLQEISRKHRYQFLIELAVNQGASAIALGHHQGDQAETLMLNLLRGAGLQGLAAMSLVERRQGISLVRPLLAESRTAIMEYLRANCLSYRIDESNAKTDYSRNLIRLEIIPTLKQLNPNIEHALARTAELLQADEVYLHQLACNLFSRLLVKVDGGLKLSVSALDEQPVALQRRIIRLAWAELAGGTQGLGYVHVREALTLLRGEVGKSISWPHGWRCLRSYEHLHFSRSEGEEGFQAVLPVPGLVELPEGLGQVSATLVANWDLASLPRDRHLVYCDLEQIGTDRLTVRNWQPGDRFQPLGLQGNKKLQDFFTDQKIEQTTRNKIPIVTAGSKIVWVAGLRLDHRFRVTPCSNRVVCLEYKLLASKAFT